MIWISVITSPGNGVFAWDSSKNKLTSSNQKTVVQNDNKMQVTLGLMNDIHPHLLSSGQTRLPSIMPATCIFHPIVYNCSLHSRWISVVVRVQTSEYGECS